MRSPTIWRDLGDRIFAELFDASKKQRKNVNMLISDESAISYQEPFRVHEHLRAFQKLSSEWGFGPVRVLISVRHQAHRLASCYAEESDRIVGACQSDFEKFVRQRLDPALRYYNPLPHEQGGITFDYDLLQQAIAQAVGAENLLLLPYELMRSQLAAFLDQWFEFLEIWREGPQVVEALRSTSTLVKRNVRSTSKDRWKLRERTKMEVKMDGTKIIRLRPGRVFGAMGLPTRIPLRWPDFEREEEIHLTPQLKREVASVYEDSNRRLAEAIEIDLGQYGYY